jgi:hypothetical protein
MKESSIEKDVVDPRGGHMPTLTNCLLVYDALAVPSSASPVQHNPH